MLTIFTILSGNEVKINIRHFPTRTSTLCTTPRPHFDFTEASGVPISYQTLDHRSQQRHHFHINLPYRTTLWMPGLNRGVTFISSFSPQPQLLTAPQASCYTAVLRSEKRHSHCPWNRPRKQLALLSLLEGHLNWSSGMLASRWAQLPVSLLIKHKSGWKCGRG